MLDVAIIYEGVIVALMILAGLSPLLSRFYKERRWILARGTVVSNTLYDVRGEGGVTWYWAPKIEFFVLGKSYGFLAGPTNSADQPPKLKVGDVVDILCKPSNPSRAISRQWRPYFVNFAVTGSIALVFLVPYAFVRFAQ